MHTINLPSGLQISFRAPKVIDRRQILKEFNREDGLTPEDLLALVCLENVDSKAVNSWDNPTNPVDLIDDWTLKDQQYYLEVFASLFFLDEDERGEASKLAKKLMSGGDTETTQAKKKA